ncbi:TetR/AcrR family transcriptional regulator [Myxococcus landrumensis]|uniref:TetR/AcrR family transcriptional regulator n=1 Tax=Myxococcus landrumensis TaxID=2813577 RepID=A0ABX7NH15_9BACT|nr:TetR/AcrR family transcriptional regulator [Myxococcus landrumus]QSQ17913.1 TetR/AcrR family transcriptional regulator [Myxococcus landrumus]
MKSDERRRAVVAAAIKCFAEKGFYGTTTHEIAELVGISQPYLYRLYSNKEALFVAAVDHVSVVMADTLVSHSRDMRDGGGAFDNVRRAYATLVADRTILRFLMQANCAVGETLVGEAVRRCYAKQVDIVRQMLGNDDAVRRWFGAGMLDNVVAVLGLEDIDEPWARILSAREGGFPVS